MAEAKVVEWPADSPVVVLDPIEPGSPRPEYCIHGRVTCAGCGDWCWLGHQTHEAVSSGAWRRCVSRAHTGTSRPGWSGPGTSRTTDARTGRTDQPCYSVAPPPNPPPQPRKAQQWLLISNPPAQ